MTDLLVRWGWESLRDGGGILDGGRGDFEMRGLIPTDYDDKTMALVRYCVT